MHTNKKLDHKNRKMLRGILCPVKFQGGCRKRHNQGEIQELVAFSTRGLHGAKSIIENAGKSPSTNCEVQPFFYLGIRLIHYLDLTGVPTHQWENFEMPDDWNEHQTRHKSPVDLTSALGRGRGRAYPSLGLPAGLSISQLIFSICEQPPIDADRWFNPHIPNNNHLTAYWVCTHEVTW